jgi:hypothetical protein
LAESSLDAVSYLGASYKLNSYTSIGTRFYVSTNRVAAKFDTDTKKTTEFSSKNTVNDPWLFVTNKSNGIFGSDDISTSLIYYIPNSDLSSKARSNGTLRLDSEIVWTLNPKIQLSYYLNPRQTFIPNGFVTVDGKETEVFARTRLIHGPNFYYNFNDNLQAYVASYLDQSVKSATPGTMDNEKVLNEAGINYVIGKLTLNPAISEEIPTKAKGIASTARYFRDDQTSYNLTAALSF